MALWLLSAGPCSCFILFDGLLLSLVGSVVGGEGDGCALLFFDLWLLYYLSWLFALRLGRLL